MGATQFLSLFQFLGEAEGKGDCFSDGDDPSVILDKCSK
jgi:hypothetical protein